MVLRTLLVALLLVAVLGLALPAVADDQADDASESSPVGESLAAAVQSTDAAASGEVNDGVFEARLERANETERAAIVEQRAAALDRRADRVERQLDALEAADSSGVDINASEPGPNGTDAVQNGSVEPTNDSFLVGIRSSAVLAELDVIRRSTNQTERRASEVDVDTAALERVRNRTDELHGRDAAQKARNVAFLPQGPSGDGPPGRSGDGPPGQNGDGPPGLDDGGPPSAGNGDGPPGANRSNAPPGNGRNQSSAGGGPPDDTPASGGDGNDEADRGNGDDGADRGNGNNGADRGNGDGRSDRGDGNGNGPGNADGTGAGGGPPGDASSRPGETGSDGVSADAATV